MPKPFNISQLKVEDTEIPRLLEACEGSQPIRFDDGEYLFHEGDGSSEIYIILQGAYVVEQKNELGEPESIASYCGDGTEQRFVGEMAALGAGCRTASVRSSGVTYSIELKPEHLEDILAKLPAFTRILCQQLTTHIKEANNVLKRLTAASAIQTTQVSAEPGEVIISQGNTADKLYNLVFGTLQWECDGQRIPGGPVLDFIEPGAYFSGTSYPATVRATTPACLVAIENTSKEAVVRNYPQLILKLYAEAMIGG